MAKAGARVTAVDISPANVAAARRQAESEQLNISFLVADAGRLPLPENCFDVVVSSHVIEHLPDPIRGLAELLRVTRDKALIALPTCINFASWALLGGDQYWVLSPRSLYGVPFGIARTIVAFVRGKEGPQEGYAGRGDLPHVWRFPWVVTRMVKHVGFQIDELEGGPLLVPYVAHYLGFLRPLQMSLDHWGKAPILRNFGFGLHVVASKHQA